MWIINILIIIFIFIIISELINKYKEGFTDFENATEVTEYDDDLPNTIIQSHKKKEALPEKIIKKIPVKSIETHIKNIFKKKKK